MRRRTFDFLVSTGGLFLVVVLAVAGGLLLWGHLYVQKQVHNQLAAQKIYFPPKGSSALKGPEFAAIQKYAGQQLTTGSQAKAYADHFIGVHLQEIGGGKTYSELSSTAQAMPNNAALQKQVQTLFQGNTLRGLLLFSYAFSTMGMLAGIAAWVSFAAAAILLILVVFGIMHYRRASPEEELLGSKPGSPSAAA